MILVSKDDKKLYDILWHSHDAVQWPPKAQKLTQFKEQIAPYFDKKIGFNWEAIPKEMGFWQSLEFAQLLDGYAIAAKIYKENQFGDTKGMFGGVLGKMATEKYNEYCQNRAWSGCALELWLVLFINHRYVRHTGQDCGYDENDRMFSLYDGKQTSPDYDSLVHELRKQLLAKNYFSHNLILNS